MQAQTVNKPEMKPAKPIWQARRSLGQWLLVTSIAFCVMITLYPFIYVLSMSFSDPKYVLNKSVWLLPKGFTLDAYKLVLSNEYIWKAYYNTIWYTLVGTILNIIFTVTAAYPLSRKQFFLRNPLMMYIVLTMFFSGGLIPTFILVSQLGLYNTRWALILPHLVSAFYIIVSRAFFQSIPDELVESSKLDGANDFTILYRIIIPLSLPILAVLTLFYAVDHWNSYFNAILYLSSGDLQPLQVYLMKVLISLSDEFVGNADTGIVRTAQVEQLKYASIIVVIAPILFIYPFLQRFFVQGMLIGAVKE
jgi:putative aldouronate transport system permease protein